MLVGYSDAVQHLLKKAENLNLLVPLARINYNSKSQVKKETQKVWGTVISSGPMESIAKFETILAESHEILLNFKPFPDYD